VEAVAFRPDGHLLAIAGRGLALWDDSTKKLTFVTSSNDTSGLWEKVVTSVAWSPDGQKLALGFWDAANTLRVLQVAHDK
jgi:WD40 repeat protein